MRAARLCETDYAEIWRVDGAQMHGVAAFGNLGPQQVRRSARNPVSREYLTGRAILDRSTIHVPDMQTATDQFPHANRSIGQRTALATPLIRDGVAIGAITMRRAEVRPFSDRHIALLESFAAHALIALENARLFSALDESNAPTAPPTRPGFAPRPSSHCYVRGTAIVFVWLAPPTLPDSQVIAIARGDDYFLGVLHSRIHELWELRLGTSLEDRPRHTPTTTFETFPFPWPPGLEPKDDPHLNAVATTAQTLVTLRDNWLNPPNATDVDLKNRTLTNLYNQRPIWLAQAHEHLDHAVLDAYGWPDDRADDQILERLLALNLQRAPA